MPALVVARLKPGSSAAAADLIRDLLERAESGEIVKHKLVTRCARDDKNGHLGRTWKRISHKAYRRRVRQSRHDEVANYEPRKSERVTSRDIS
jgi:hypothetical protein